MMVVSPTFATTKTNKAWPLPDETNVTNLPTLAAAQRILLTNDDVTQTT
jgi:hypothetical protein